MEPFIAEIKLFAGNFAPRGWAFCNGQTLQIAQHTALFSLLGTTYGGDGRTTFKLPDLRGRVPVHAGTGPGLTERRLGTKGGSESATLASTTVSTKGVARDPATVAKPGGVDNMQPFCALNYIIALEGVFPSRS